MEWLSESYSYVAPAVGVSFFTQSGNFFDIEFLVPSGDPEAIEEPARSELAVTAGTRFDNGLVLFGGYKAGSTEGKNLDTDDILVESAGLFAGISKSFSLSEKSGIALSAAVAAMDATVDLEWSDERTVDMGEDLEYEGASVGLSGSAAFNYALTTSTTTSLGVKHQSYDYEDDIGEETVTSIFAKLAYRF